jgi:hypothetical protein
MGRSTELAGVPIATIDPNHGVQLVHDVVGTVDQTFSLRGLEVTARKSQGRLNSTL